MPNYEFKCDLGHKTEERMSFDAFEEAGRQIRCRVVVGSGNRECEFQALPTFHVVQFIVEPGWWDDEADRAQVDQMLRK